MKERLQQAVKDAMKARDTRRLGTIRLLMAAIKQKEVDERISVDDQQVLAIIEKMIKQRRDSLSQFEQAGREDLAQQERFEIDVLQEYLPAQLSAAEIEKHISDSITELGANSMKDMGKVMAKLKSELQGRADMEKVSSIVKLKLSE